MFSEHQSWDVRSPWVSTPVDMFQRNIFKTLLKHEAFKAGRRVQVHTPPPLQNPHPFWQKHANIGIQKYFVTFLGNVSQEGIATQPLS